LGGQTGLIAPETPRNSGKGIPRCCFATPHLNTETLNSNAP
jgi:hypothetical protein